VPATPAIASFSQPFGTHMTLDCDPTTSTCDIRESIPRHDSPLDLQAEQIHTYKHAGCSWSDRQPGVELAQGGAFAGANRLLYFVAKPDGWAAINFPVVWSSTTKRYRAYRDGRKK